MSGLNLESEEYGIAWQKEMSAHKISVSKNVQTIKKVNYCIMAENKRYGQKLKTTGSKY